MFKSRWDPAERGGQSKFWEKTYLIGPNVKQDGISWAGRGLLSAQLCACGRALQQVVGLLGTRWAP